MKHLLLKMLSSCMASWIFIGCAGGGNLTVAGNDNGSPPVNAKEANDYRKAVLKCYKTGGTRVIKISGNLRCY